MPTNVLPKDTPRGRGPEPSQGLLQSDQGKETSEDAQRESDLAAKEIQDVWEAEEIGITNWSEQGSQRYSDPE